MTTYAMRVCVLAVRQLRARVLRVIYMKGFSRYMIAGQTCGYEQKASGQRGRIAFVQCGDSEREHWDRTTVIIRIGFCSGQRRRQALSCENAGHGKVGEHFE